jgi:hypothetical protein
MAAIVNLRNLARAPAKGVRHLHLHHHQSVALLARANVPTTPIELAQSPEQVADAFSKLFRDNKSDKAILRAELTGADGRRGLEGGAFEGGTAGVRWAVDSSAHFCFFFVFILLHLSYAYYRAAKASDIAKRVLERAYNLPNAPTGLHRVCRAVSLVPAPQPDAPAFRVLIYCDRSLGGPALLGSTNLDATRGLRSLSENERVRLAVDFNTGLTLEQASEFVAKLGIEQKRDEAARILVDVYERIFRAAEALTVEVRLERDPVSGGFLASVSFVLLTGRLRS